MSDSIIEQVKRLAEAQKTGALFDKVSRLSGGKFIAERLSFDFPALLAHIATQAEALKVVAEVLKAVADETISEWECKQVAQHTLSRIAALTGEKK